MTNEAQPYDSIIGVDSGCDPVHPIRLFVTSVGDYLREIEANMGRGKTMKISGLSLISNDVRFGKDFHGLMYDVCREVEQRNSKEGAIHVSLGKGDRRVNYLWDDGVKPEKQIEILGEVYESALKRLKTLGGQ